MAGAKILVLEDEERLLRNIHFILAGEGHVVVIARNGEEGIEKLREESYDLVITDIMMPEVDGFGIIDYINNYAPETLVIVITGYASTDSAIEALRRGAYDYLPKPFDIHLLKIAVSKALDKITLQKRLREYTESLELLAEKQGKREPCIEKDVAKRDTVEKLGDLLATLLTLLETMREQLDHLQTKELQKNLETVKVSILDGADLVRRLHEKPLKNAGGS
ncbi:MAG: response regulator [Candidatus Tectomicrobia bacterium]|nr:response regulator [Candidatus Tectomicrobia bacterium]